ncbi:hypothetical protein BX600DRAFT_163088 [Xylariales sp. PMI_506]|nr:hypothetical protein BX600DRAFT_163088 [Xylariales sp. PMI_506]
MPKFERQAQSQRKHGPPSVSSASKAPRPPPSTRPGWTGPSLLKKAARNPQSSASSSAPKPVAPTLQDHLLPDELLQLTLDIFRDTFPASQDFAALKPLLHQINHALLQRDFDTAFGSQEFREGYAIRWSPSRTLAYSNLLASICEQRGDDLWVQQLIEDDVDGKAAKVVSFGGGAAEVMAFASLSRHLRKDVAGRPSDGTLARGEDGLEDFPASSESSPATTAFNLHLIDTADWSMVASKLQAGLVTPPMLSKYASATARAMNAAFLTPQAANIDFTRADVLAFTLEELQSIIGTQASLLTFFFTLNDLYNTSIPKATSFLRKITSVVPSGSLLLVVDSPEISFGTGSAKDGEEKTGYPMDWILDKTLLQVEKQKEGEDKPEPAWEKVLDDANRLYKLPEKGLNYPVSMENLRMQVHLYRRL